MYKHKCKLLALAAITAAAMLISTNLAAERSSLPIDVSSESGRYDVRSGAYHLIDNVRIVRGNLTVQANEAKSFSNEAGQIQRIELYGNPTTWSDVLEDGNEVDGESSEIIYDFTRNIITMLGDARIRNVQGSFSGSKLVYDLDSQDLVGDGGVRLIIEPDTTERAEAQPPDTQPDPDN